MKQFGISLLLLATSVATASAATLLTGATSTRDDFTGLVATVFTSTNASTTINYLGYIDQGDNGLSAAHTVGLYLWDGSAYALQTSATIPAGTGSDLFNGYRWVSIPAITLADTQNTYWAVVATVATGSGDGWGSTGTADAAIGTIGSPTSGYYNTLTPSLTPTLATSGGDAAFQGAVFYNAGNIATAIPEASAAILGGLGSLVLLRRRR